MSRVLVLGLGVTGDAVVRHRAAAGDDVTVVEDAVRGVEVNQGDSERALADMRKAGAKVASSDEVLAAAEAG